MLKKMINGILSRICHGFQQRQIYASFLERDMISESTWRVAAREIDFRTNYYYHHLNISHTSYFRQYLLHVFSIMTSSIITSKSKLQVKFDQSVSKAACCMSDNMLAALPFDLSLGYLFLWFCRAGCSPATFSLLQSV